MNKQSLIYYTRGYVEVIDYDGEAYKLYPRIKYCGLLYRMVFEHHDGCVSFYYKCMENDGELYGIIAYETEPYNTFTLKQSELDYDLFYKNKYPCVLVTKDSVYEAKLHCLVRMAKRLYKCTRLWEGIVGKWDLK